MSQPAAASPSNETGAQQPADRLLANVERIASLLDDAFRIPVVGWRFGWDAILGLIPWVGDATGALFGALLLVAAVRSRVPAVVVLRMAINVVGDCLIGLIPVAGDVIDLFIRSNKRNLDILRRHAGGGVPPTTSDWWIVSLAFALVLSPFVVVLLVVWKVASWIAG